MSNFGTSLVKLTLLASGAVLGTLIARWLDETLTARLEEQSEQDKTRYERGLTPVVVVTPVENEKSSEV
jgi:hypothetical protein